MTACATKECTVAIVPRVDIIESAETVVVTAELPGVSKDGVELNVKDGVLSLVGKKAESAAEGYVRLAERRHGEYHRTFALGPSLDITKVDAQMENGILRITLYKAESVKPRRISIN